MKTKISQVLRRKVWQNEYGCRNATGKCPCCRDTTISVWDFEAGHVTSEYNGGPLHESNLRPICHKCNLSMGRGNWEPFASQFSPAASFFRLFKTKLPVVQDDWVMLRK